MEKRKIERVAILTANIGNIDPVLGIPRQDMEVDFYYYCDNNLPFPLPNLGNRLKSKYLKAQTHRFLPDYDIYIWIDGRVKVEGINFARDFVDKLNEHDLAIYHHRQRKNVYEEINYIVQCMCRGDKYLLERYGNQELTKEAVFYKEEGVPNDYPLYMATLFARRNNKETNDCFDEWWRRIIEFSYFDQTMLSYATFKHELKVNLIQYDELRTHKLFKIESHNATGDK